MKTYFRDFSMAENSLVKGCGQLEEVINNRQEKFTVTTEYQEEKEKARADLRRILSVCSGTGSIEDIEEALFPMECICYSAAYRDGVSDLMAAMTFNQLNLTKIEYVELSKGA